MACDIKFLGGDTFLVINKKDVIRLLETIAIYMEINGDNPFRVAAFRKAATSLEKDVRSLQEIEDFTSLPNIGKGTAATIEEYIQNGQSSVLNELKGKVPEGLLPLLQIPGLGGKSIAKLYKELGIKQVADLEKACLEKQVQTIPGFGAKTEANILNAIQAFGTKPSRLPVAFMLTVAEELEQSLKQMDGIERFSRAGSLRRMKETIKDLDYIISTEQAAFVKEQLLQLPNIKEIIAAGMTKVSITFSLDYDVSVDFRLVNEAAFATALHHFTGSKEHNIRMRQLAKNRGERISEYGVEHLSSGKLKTFATEQQFFQHFQLPYIPPEIREDGTEVDTITKDTSFLSLSDIKGDLHMHTTWSDGANSLEEMVIACRERGYEYMAITDHSQYLKVANGLSKDRLRKQQEEIQRLNEKYPDILILSGVEMDILPDGTLDFEDEFLAELDFVIASIHSAFSQSEEKIMERLTNALKNPYVHMIAHPTGRIIGRREGYELNMDRFIELAKETNTILELNANPNRLDLTTLHLQKAYEAGVMVAINTDAHQTKTLNHMEIGVAAAKKAWTKPEFIVNTLSSKQLQQFLKRK